MSRHQLRTQSFLRGRGAAGRMHVEGSGRALGGEGADYPGRAHSSMARILFYFQPGSQRAPLSLGQAAPVEPRAETARHPSLQEVATRTHSPGLDSCLRVGAARCDLLRERAPMCAPGRLISERHGSVLTARCRLGGG